MTITGIIAILYYMTEILVRLLLGRVIGKKFRRPGETDEWLDRRIRRELALFTAWREHTERFIDYVTYRSKDYVKEESAFKISVYLHNLYIDELIG